MAGSNNTTSPSLSDSREVHDDSYLSLDVFKLLGVDWDAVHDGEKLIQREYKVWNALNIIRMTLALWIITSHLAIFVFIGAKSSLRARSKNLLLINVEIANLIMGAFIVPVRTFFIHNPGAGSCHIAVIWLFIAHYFQTSLLLFAVLAVVMERFAGLYAERKLLKPHAWLRCWGNIALGLGPWIFPLLILIPLFYSGLHAHHGDYDSCLFQTDDNYFVAAQVLSYLPAALGVFILAPFTGLLDCLRPWQCLYQPLSPKGETLIITAVISFVTIFAEAPYCVIRILMMRLECNNSYCGRFSEALSIAMWIRIIKAAVFPFIWLAYKDIRDAMMCDGCKTKKLADDEAIEEEESHLNS